MGVAEASQWQEHAVETAHIPGKRGSREQEKNLADCNLLWSGRVCLLRFLEVTSSSVASRGRIKYSKPEPAGDISDSNQSDT